MTLTGALSPEDKEVLAYLISCSSTNFSNNHRTIHKTTNAAAAISGCAKVDADHSPSFNCNCFRCYMNYWTKWDSSPNRQLIYEVIDTYEDNLLMQNKKYKSKRERRKGKSTRESGQGSEVSKKSEFSLIKNYFDESNSVSESTSAGGAETGGTEEDDGKKEELEKGSVRNFVSFLGEKIWSVWTLN
ncbi:hypothetical protein Adt_46006 [Abeliophyllum distichum]|uniref:Uncharacterized protein n=1 Tax=Abeliophyllum distichum TaxID=126358 RepID=A0ABD1P311_9LAMI